MLIPIVDENDVQIGMKERDALNPGTDICRVSALWLTNAKGEVLIARRSLAKRFQPGLWSCAVAGVVEGDESYELNMIRETQEEVGLMLTPAELTLGPKLRRAHIFIQWYLATKDIAVADLKLQEGEVMEARWVSPEALRKWTKDAPHEFVESFVEFFESLG